MPAKSKKVARRSSAKKSSAGKKTTRKKTTRKTTGKKTRARKSAPAAAAAKQELLTLTEVAKKVNISLPSAQRYKKLYQERIPSVGEGRKQRYPESAVAVFAEIKAENLKRRGRPRKQQSVPAAGKPKRAAKKKKRAPAPKKAARPASKLITLTEISKRTGISYPTCVSYVKKYGDRIPHEGEGRKRRFPESAVPVFKEIRSQSRRGRRAKAAAPAPRRQPRAQAPGRALARQIRALEKAQAENARLLKRIVKLLERPVRVTLSRR